METKKQLIERITRAVNASFEKDHYLTQGEANLVYDEILKHATNDAEAQLERYRGALRTLAKIVNCEDCPFNDECSYREFDDRECLGPEKIIAYALAHPTEEGK